MAYKKPTNSSSQSGEKEDKYRDRVIKLKPFTYIHVLDRNSNVARLETGPQTFTCMNHETVIQGPERMQIVPPRHYCVIEDPVLRDADGNIMKDEHDNIKLRHGDREIRFEQDPFPLYPGEKLKSSMLALKVVPEKTALRLQASRDFEDEVDGKVVKRTAGEEWLFQGPQTYKPRVEIDVIETIEASIVESGQALKIRARNDCNDKAYNLPRKSGERWLMRKDGAYLPAVEEVVEEVVDSILISERTALHLRAVSSFKDVYGKDREAGDEWLITYDIAHSHLPDVHEEVVNVASPLITLTKRQYCCIKNPIDSDNKAKIGEMKLVRGPKNFFLQPPYEQLVGSISEVQVLTAEEAIELQAKEQHVNLGKTRYPGECWLFHGPGEYWPPLEVKIIRKHRAAIAIEPLGIYVFKPENYVAAFFVIIVALLFLYFFSSPLLRLVFGSAATAANSEL